MLIAAFLSSSPGLYLSVGHALTALSSVLTYFYVHTCGGVAVGGVLKAVAAATSGEAGTQREPVLFHHIRSLCGCQNPAAA